MANPLARLQHALADRYTIERELGQGGMATVYLAHDLKHDRPVALKVLRQELAAAMGAERFHREIQIAAKLQHPNILPLHDSGEAGGFLYYVMPFVEGQSLRERLAREGALPVGDAVRILRDVVDALTEAHAHGVVHRDIKPENIMLRGRHALVTDFGVAKAVSEATGRQTLTTAGVALGTPAYMAPEQASADPHVDHRVDIYAVGAVAYELLTGRPVFMGTTPQMVLSAHVTEAPVPITKYRESVPRALEALVMRCLEKQPADRWQSAEELLPQLEALATPSGGITPTETAPVAAVAGRWRMATLGVGAAVVLTVVGVAAWQLLKPKLLTIVASVLTQITNVPGVEFEPAISPDGKQVAYLAGRFWAPHLLIRSTVNPAAGGEIRLSDTTFEAAYRPRWSADGDFVRFIGCRGGRCAWYETGKLGGAIRPAPLPEPARWQPRLTWSADDARVAYFAGDTLLVTSVAGPAPPRRIAVHPEHLNPAYLGTAGPDSPTWSPDGKLIAYVYGSLYMELAGALRGSEIWVVSATGGSPHTVASDEHFNGRPTWLDARHLLFVSNRDGAPGVYAVEVGARGARGKARAIPGIADPYSISYAIGSRQLAWAKFTVRQNIWSYPLGRSTPTSIRDGARVTTGSETSESADVSRDGKWLVFDSNRRGNLDLYRTPLSGGEPVSLTDAPENEYSARWSPDGTEIAYSVSGAAGKSPGSLMVMPAAGGAPATLTNTGHDNNDPEWSPDGLHIAFQSTRTGRFEAWLISRDSLRGAWHHEVQLTDSGAFVRDWAPDGSGVLCDYYGPNGGRLFLVSLQGRVLWRRDLAPLGLPFVGFAHFSRDGRTVYVDATHRDGRRGIWAIPMSGGVPRLVVVADDAARVIPETAKSSIWGDRLYFAVQEYESDIWVAKLKY